MGLFRCHLYDARRKARLTQQQLADRLGIERSVYVWFETGKADPPAHLLRKLCDVCGVTPDELRRGKSKNNE